MATAVAALEIPLQNLKCSDDYSRFVPSPTSVSVSPPWTMVERPDNSKLSSTNSLESQNFPSSPSSYVMVSVDAPRPSAQSSMQRGTLSPPNGRMVQLLFSKSKVFVHPTSSSKDYIPGFLALVRPEGASDLDILLAWVPESVIQAEDYNSYVKVDMDSESSSLYSSTTEIYVSRPISSTSISSYAFSIPLRKLYSLQIKSPSLGWWWGSIIVHTRTEETLPALYFHDAESESTVLLQKQHEYDPFKNTGWLTTSNFSSCNTFWGGSQFLKVLEMFSNIEQSAMDSDILLVNPGPDDRTYEGIHSSSEKEDKLAKALVNAKWAILEKMASLTHMSLKASQGVLDNAPTSIRKLLSQPEVQKIGNDFGAARYYLAKWAVGIAEEAERSHTRRIIWNDGYQDFLSNYMASVGCGFESELLTVDFDVERRNEIGTTEWEGFFDETGVLSNIKVDKVKELIFHGGLAPCIRADAWLFLLGVYPWNSSTEERHQILSQKRDEYYRLKRQWWHDTVRQKTDEFWKDQKCRIEKDVYRTDRNISLFEESDTPHPDGPKSRFADVGTNLHLEQMKDMLITYNEFNVNLGYVQGMSDMLSPLYVIFQDDAVAFCAFCQFMTRMERNFLRDQGGMRQQMLTLDQLIQLMDPELSEHLNRADSINFFFFFRMLLVWYKREFEWDSVLRLWEVLWTDYLSSQFVLFIALALLDKHRTVILSRLNQFDEILKYMNDLAMTIDLEDILVRAEVLFRKFKRTVEMIDLREAERRLSCSGDSVDLENGLTPSSNISSELRQLLSRDVVIEKEEERPPNVGGG